MERILVLSSDETWINPISIIKHYGEYAETTDFAKLLGQSDMECLYWLQDDYLSSTFCVRQDKPTDPLGVGEIKKSNRFVGIRPVIKYDGRINVLDKKIVNKTSIRNNIYQVEYGFYPQDVASRELEDILESKYQNNNLSKTTNFYTIEDLNSSYSRMVSFVSKKLEEYQYKNSRFVRVEANPYSNEVVLSNGKKYVKGDYAWVEVRPLTWYLSEAENIMLCKKIILSGIPFAKEIISGPNIMAINYENSTLNYYLQEYLLKEIKNSLPFKVQTESHNDIDSIFEEATNRMNEINSGAKTKVLK